MPTGMPPTPCPGPGLRLRSPRPPVLGLQPPGWWPRSTWASSSVEATLAPTLVPAGSSIGTTPAITSTATASSIGKTRVATTAPRCQNRPGRHRQAAGQGKRNRSQRIPSGRRARRAGDQPDSLEGMVILPPAAMAAAIIDRPCPPSRRRRKTPRGGEGFSFL